MKIQEPSSSFASSSKLMALQLVHPIKGSASGLVQLAQLELHIIKLLFYNFHTNLTISHKQETDFLFKCFVGNTD